MSIIPLEVVTRNVIAGSLSKRLGMEEGTVLAEPIVEFYFKDDDLGDPLVTEDHIRVLNVASPGASKRITRYGSTNQSSVD